MAIVTEESAPASTGAPVNQSRVDESTPAAECSIVNRQSFRSHPLFLLALITLLGAFLRFVSLDQPALWGDEAFTYSRVCGSFRQLLDVLQFDGFMPLHYVLYWWLGNHVELSPVMMRVPVAFAGALMPPAMYFLARQLGISTKISLVIALFAACSAYMLAYSRDAKMYMPFWLFCAVHMGCLLWWMHRRVVTTDHGGSTADDDEPPATWGRWSLKLAGRLAWSTVHTTSSLACSAGAFRWLCWVAAGCAMIGYHALGLMIVSVEVLIFLTHRNLHWKRIGPFVVGVAILLLLVVGHFGYFTDWENRVSENWSSSGVQWVNGYNAERGGADLATFASTAFLMSWEWPVKSWQSGIDPRVLKTLMTVSVAFGLLAGVGLLCSLSRYAGGGLGWGFSRRTQKSILPNDSSFNGHEADHARRPTQEPSPRPSPGVPGEGVAPWRAMLWLGAWLLLPAYAIYCKSVLLGKIPFSQKTGTLFAPPWIIARDVAETIGYGWIAGTAAVVLLLICFWRSESTLRSRMARFLAMMTVAALLFGLLCAEFGVLRAMAVRAAAQGDRWHSFWMPRYLGALWPALAIILCVLLMCLPTRPLRVGAIALLLAVNLAQFSVRVWGSSEPPTDVMARDIVAAQPLYVRQSQVALDLTRATFALGTGLDRPRFDRAIDQSRKLPVVTPTARTYMQTGIWSPEPGGGVLGSYAMRFYLCYYVGVDADAPTFRRRTALVDRQWTVVSGTSPRLIAADMQKMPSIDRVITWDRYDRGRRDNSPADPIAKALGPNWRRIDDKMFSVRDHWTWMNKYQLRRREYVKVSQPTTVPSTGPSRQRSQ